MTRLDWNTFYAAGVEWETTRDEWFPPPGEAAGARAARHRIAAQLRAVADVLVGLRTEALADSALDTAEQAAAALVDSLRDLPQHRSGSPARAAPPDGALVERSPVSGRANPMAPPLNYAFEGEVTRAWGVFSTAYEGPPGGVHGGCVAAAFDEVLGVAQTPSGLVGFTGTLAVRYLRLMPLGQRIDFEARIVGRRDRKVTIAASATAGGRTVAEAEGLFIVQFDRSSWSSPPAAREGR